VTAHPPSYRALLGVPWLARALAGMQLIRIAQSMIGVALVLFSLSRYGSPAIAGLVTFASIVPGLLISPIGGALLDRHGRTRLILLDLVMATASMGLIAVLAFADALPAGLTLVSATPSTGAYAGGVWTVGALPNGASATANDPSGPASNATGCRTRPSSCPIRTTSVACVRPASTRYTV